MITHSGFVTGLQSGNIDAHILECMSVCAHQPLNEIDTTIPID